MQIQGSEYDDYLSDLHFLLEFVVARVPTDRFTPPLGLLRSCLLRRVLRGVLTTRRARTEEP